MKQLVLKPTLKSYFKNGGYFRIGIAVLFLACLIVFRSQGPLVWVTPLVVVIFIVILINFYIRRVTVDSTRLRYIGWLGKHVSISLKEIDHVVYASQYMEYNYGDTDRIFIVKSSGAAHFSTVGAYWHTDDLAQLAKFLESKGIKVVREEETTDSNYFLAKNPSITTYVERRPFTLAWIIVGGLVIAYIIWFLIFQLPKY